LPGSIVDKWRERRRRTVALQAVVAGVRAESSGLDREQIRALLVARIEDLGLYPPVAENAIDAIAAHLHNGDNSDAIRLAATSAGRAIRGPFEVAAYAKRTASYGTNMAFEKEPVLLTIDRSLPTLPVRLDPGAEEWLSQVTRSSKSPISHPIEIFVELSIGDDADRHAVIVRSGNRRIGTLDEDDHQVIGPIVAAGTAGGKPVVTQALQERDSAGAWHVSLYQSRRSRDR
jgi:hypothetical protein